MKARTVKRKTDMGQDRDEDAGGGHFQNSIFSLLKTKLKLSQLKCLFLDITNKCLASISKLQAKIHYKFDFWGLCTKHSCMYFREILKCDYIDYK